jgi:PAP2 superfamily C-terminal
MDRERVQHHWNNVVAYYQLTPMKVFSLILVVLPFLFIIFSMNVIANLGSFWSPVKAYNPPLSDALNELFNSNTYRLSYNEAANAVMYAFGGVTIFLIIINRLALFIAIKLITALTITYFLRCTTVPVTNLPDSWQRGNRILTDFYSEFSTDRGGDLIFSGHTLLVALFAHCHSSFYLLGNSMTLHVLSGLFGWISAGLVMVFIVVGRLHYTIDVLLGLYIASGVWWSLSYFFSRFFREPVFKMSFKERNAPMNITALEEAAPREEAPSAVQ